jgi:hypothetical protein
MRRMVSRAWILGRNFDVAEGAAVLRLYKTNNVVSRRVWLRAAVGALELRE